MVDMEVTTMTEPALSPAAVPPASMAPNKQRSRRCLAKGTTRLRICRTTMGLGPNIALSLLDLSESGLRVVLKEAVTLGQEVEVQLECAGSGRILKSPAKVVRVQPGENGTFVVGLQLQKTINYGDLQALAKP